MALTDNLVSYYKLDESSGNAADSVGSNTLTNTSVTYAASKINNGAVFNATTDNLAIADASQTGLDLSGDSSFSFWVNFTAVPASGAAMWLFQKFGASGNYGYRAYQFNNGGTQGLWFECSANGTTNTSATVNWTPSTDTWYYLTFVYTASAGSCKFYVNGSQQGATQTGLATSIYNNASPFCLGSQNGAQALNGSMDEAGIWSRALSSTEVTSLYNSGNGMAYPFGSTFEISESLAMSETTSNLRARLFTLSESLAMSETASALKGLLFTISESLNLTETFTGLRTRLFTVAENMGLVEVLAQIKTKWERMTKSTSTFTNQSKSSSSWTNKDKS